MGTTKRSLTLACLACLVSILVGTPVRADGDEVIIGANVRANSRDTCPDGHGITQREPALAVTGNAVVVEYGDYRAFFCNQLGYETRGWSYSLDGGKTFADAAGFPGGSSGDPWLAAGSEEGVFYSVGGSSNPLPGRSLSVVKGTVNGEAIVLSGEARYEDDQYPLDRTAITADPRSDVIYVVFTRGLGAKSLDLLRLHCGHRPPEASCTFEDGSSIAHPDSPSHSVVVDEARLTSGQLLVGPQGEVYVIYKNAQDPASHRVFFTKSTDQGHNWSEPTLVAEPVNYHMPGSEGAVQGRENPTTVTSFAIDRSGGPSQGTLYVAWESALEPGSPFSNILLSRSSDGGSSWSTPLVVNDNHKPRAHGFPALTVNSKGVVDVLFYDRRGFGPDEQWTNLYLARSNDAGVSFERNVSVTDQPSLWSAGTAGDKGPGMALGRFGDYITAVSQGEDTIVAWTDAREGDPDIYVARITTNHGGREG